MGGALEIVGLIKSTTCQGWKSCSGVRDFVGLIAHIWRILSGPRVLGGKLGTIDSACSHAGIDSPWWRWHGQKSWVLYTMEDTSLGGGEDNKSLVITWHFFLSLALGLSWSHLSLQYSWRHRVL